MRQIHGDQIQDEQIKDKHVAPNAAIAQSKIQGLSTVSSNVDALKLLNEFENQVTGHTEFLYNTGKLVEKKIWEDDSKSVLLFSKVFSYTLEGKLEYFTLTRQLDNYAIRCDFVYDVNGKLISKTVIEA